MEKAFVYLYDSPSEKPLNEQRGIIKDYAKKHDMEIIKEFVEADDSIPSEKFRPVLQDIMEALKDQNDIDYILVENFKCIAPDITLFGWVKSNLQEIIQVKTRVHSATQVNDYYESPEKYLATVFMTYYGMRFPV